MFDSSDSPMTDALTFSVIITTHNRPQLVVACVESVLAQTVLPLEIAVVDDGSRPATARALAPYVEDARIRYFWQRQQGWGAARLAGVRHSQGAILAFLDDDCIAPPEWLACYASAYAGHPDAGGIGGGLRPGVRMNLAGRKQYDGHRAYFEQLNAPLGATVDQPGRVWFTFGGNRTFRRDVWLSAQPDRWAWYHDDTLIDLRLREQGVAIYYTPDAWVTHHYVLSVAQRVRASYRYGRSERQAQIASIPVSSAESAVPWHSKWRGLGGDYPEVPLSERLWYASTQPLAWIARWAGQHARG
jgi:glycosyltransferase involved in cell wall biosynthesis